MSADGSSSGAGAPRAAIVSIGDEITLGQSLDTNSGWLAERLGALGVVVVEHVSLPDDRRAITEGFARLAGGVSMLVSTGGLGPTADDLTREALADALGCPLVEDAEAAARIGAWLAQRGRELTAAQRTQARRPAPAACLWNDRGTAPGLRARLGMCEVFCLPGPPVEMRAMFERDAAAHAAQVARAAGARAGLTTRLVHACGLAEADAAERLGAILSRERDPLVGITVSNTIVTLRVRREGSGGADIEAVEETAREIRAALGAHVFGEGDDTLAGAVVGALVARGMTLATAESCTGGLLAGAITDVAGSSGAFRGGWVVYSDAMKERELGVSRATLEAHGAVSKEAAREMARGALERSGASAALSVTGIAGPNGGTEEKPVGTVFLGLAMRGEGPQGALVKAHRRLFTGDRATIRARTVQAALAWMWLRLRGAPGVRLVGQVDAPERGDAV